MSDFRAKVGVEQFYQILFQIIAQAVKVGDFLNPVLSAVDSRPLFANVGGPKTKHCNCADKKSCSCEKTFTDPDAAVGAMRNKTNMNKFFVGYRKHTIICHSKQGPVPLISITTPGSSYSFLFGGTTSNKPVNEHTAMQMTAVYSCVRILAEAVAGLPLHLYKYTASGGNGESPLPPAVFFIS